MDVLFELREFAPTREALLQFLNRIRDVVDPAAPPFRFEPGKTFAHFKPINAFYFALILQRWERDQEANKWSNSVPWRVVVAREQSVLSESDVPMIWVCKHILGDKCKPMWSMWCEELVGERQVIPEQQKSLRGFFGLRTRDGCSDSDFFHDKFKIMGIEGR